MLLPIPCQGPGTEHAGVAKTVIPTAFIVHVVVRCGQRYLLVRERKRGHGWYLPGGRVEFGESLSAAARRETLEETGVPVALDGLLRIEHNPVKYGARTRFIFTARPEIDVPPKREPDRESLGARWFEPEALGHLHLHDPEAADFIRYVDAGAAIFPLELLASAGAPMPLLHAR